jgi:quercetin dioxygenase-like cupin family protein
VIIESLDAQELDEAWCAGEPAIRHSSSWPAWAGEGSDAAACYFEIPPGCSLGRHVHDAEEQVVILEGEATATVAGRSQRLTAPGLVVMPKGEPHDLRNEGDGTLRAIGYFPQGRVTTTFDVELQPKGSRILGTPDRS